MVRARMARVAVAAALGLACGCSSMSSSCSGCSSWTSRLTGLFHRNSAPAEVVGAPIDGPPIGDPGLYEGPGCLPLPPQSGPPPLIPPPHPYGPNEAQRMPYQP